MAICDRGYRGKRRIGDTRIEIPESGKGPRLNTKAPITGTLYAAVPPSNQIIVHLKNDHKDASKLPKADWRF
jgi:IS5 family transposase